jgi:hypothetical protein
MLNPVTPGIQPVRERPWTNRWRGPFFVPAVQLVLSAFFLLLICNRHYVYEEDELAKAAQVITLATDAHWLHFAEVTDYYSKDTFSAYYLLATACYKLTPLGAIETLNLLSVLLGAIFFAALPVFVRRVFGLPSWLTWIALLSSPILVLTFCYGNEAALALTASTLAALALSFKTRSGAVAAALCYGVAVYSRSDYLLLGPALGLLTIVRTGRAVAWPPTLRQALYFYLTALVFGLGYLGLVLHHVPEPGLLVYHTNPKLLAAFLLYSPNPVTVAFALLGFGICLIRQRRKFLLLLVVLLQSIPYATMLSSPKYILPTFVVTIIFAVVGMQILMQRSRLALVILLVLPWIVAVTPFGLFGPARAAFWYVPTDDGPLPTGGYLAFYPKVKQGFYQERYFAEYQEMAKAMTELERNPEHSDLVGFFNIQTLRLWAVEHQRWEIPPNRMRFWDSHLDREEPDRTRLMLKTSYLYRLHDIPRTFAKLDVYFKNGSLRSIAPGVDADPFPDVIQFGPPVPPGSDSELGQRILFCSQYYGGNQPVRRNSFIPDLSSLSWLPRTQFAGRESQLPKPLYGDSQWVCFSEPVEHALFYSLRYPKKYSGFK